MVVVTCRRCGQERSVSLMSTVFSPVHFFCFIVMRCPNCNRLTVHTRRFVSEPRPLDDGKHDRPAQ